MVPPSVSGRGGFAALVGLLRPVNGLMAAAGVLVGALVSRSPTWWAPALMGGASTFFAASAANALNDRVDVVSDRINRPDRPIPSGRLSPGAAVFAAAVCALASLALATAVGPWAVALVAAWLAATALYSGALKGVPIVGNVAVSLVASTPLLMGGISQGRYAPALIPCALAFLVHLAREIVKDVEDLEGDRAAGLSTFAVRYGVPASYTLARGIVIALIGLAAIPFGLGIYGWGYACVVVAIDAMLVWLVSSLGTTVVKSGPRGPSNVLKLVMALGLLAFILGVL